MWSRMTDALFRELVEAAALSYRRSGRYAWHFAKGKLGGDPVFRFLLSTSVLPSAGRLLDLGCGQGVLMALLRSAAARHAEGAWPADWPPPPRNLDLQGVELGFRRARTAQAALGDGATVVRDRDADNGQLTRRERDTGRDACAGCPFADQPQARPSGGDGVAAVLAVEDVELPQRCLQFGALCKMPDRDQACSCRVLPPVLGGGAYYHGDLQSKR